MMERRVRATNLESVIRAQGRTKVWVAGHAGVSKSMMSMVLSGQRTLGIEAAERVAGALGVPFFVVFESSEEDKDSESPDSGVAGEDVMSLEEATA